MIVNHVSVTATEGKHDVVTKEIESTEIKDGFIIKNIVTNKPILSYMNSDGTLYEYKKESLFIPYSNERLEQPDDEEIYSSSFRLLSTIVYNQKYISGDKYIQVIEFYGGYEQLDSRCQFLSSDITVGIQGLSEFGNMYEYSKDYYLGDQDIWSKRVIGADYINHRGDPISGLFNVGIIYNYKVAHADNVFYGSWSNYLL